MVRMCFSLRLIKVVMECVSTFKYEILDQELSISQVVPQRGLRQGDPLSSYLFILVAEGLSATIREAESRNGLNGIAIAIGALKVSHLLFADDSFFFFKVLPSKARTFKGILDLYATASGQTVNLEKYDLFFSSNVRDDLRASLSSIMGISNMGGSGYYLGLPSMVGRNKDILNYIKSRIVSRIHIRLY